MPGENSGRLDERNRERVRLYIARNPGATQAACARSLGLSANAVNRHVKALAEAAGCRPRHYPAQAARKETP